MHRSLAYIAVSATLSFSRCVCLCECLQFCLGFFFDGGGEERNENENVATVERSKKKRSGIL